VAAIFQDFTHFELTARDNIAFGSLARRDDSAAVERAAERAGAAELVKRLPQGWDTVLTRQLRGGAQLSGGEWQRLALARALFAVDSGAGVLVLDEPTADRIVVLEEGRVVEDGSHQALMSAGGRYAAMYTLQASRFEPVPGEEAATGA
jgi:ATP-binding cassette subfamily B protein